MLSFFSWMKQINSKWTIYDASSYFIVNRTPEKKLKSLGNNPKAEDIVDILLSELNKPKRFEIKENCELREKYLKKAIKISGKDIQYINSKTSMSDPEFKNAFQEALELVQYIDKKLVDKINPNTIALAPKLYLPLEIAETIYLKNKFNIDTKFGPTTEVLFDEAIKSCMNIKNENYNFIRCPKGPNKPAYLSDKEVIWTKTPDYSIRNILKNTEYKEFVTNYTKSFENNFDLESSCIKLQNKFKLNEVI